MGVVPWGPGGLGQPVPALTCPSRQAACSTWTPETRPCWTTPRPLWPAPCVSAAAWQCCIWRTPACRGDPSCCLVSSGTQGGGAVTCCPWGLGLGQSPRSSRTPPATALKMNVNLRELYLADNKLNGLQDSAQLGNLLKFNSSLQILDLRNNHVLDSGARAACPCPPHSSRRAPTVPSRGPHSAGNTEVARMIAALPSWGSRSRREDRLFPGSDSSD